MKKITESYYCDCCNKQFDRFTTRFVNDNHYKVNSIVLPILFHKNPKESDDDEKVYYYDTRDLHDICDDCMEKILKFSTELLHDKMESYK